MPLFTVAKTTLSPVNQTNFATEKNLQTLIESNLESVFGMCPEVRGKRTAPSTPSSEYHIRRQPPRVREPRSDVGSRRCVVVESGQRR